MLTDYPSITSGHRLGSTSLMTNTTGGVISETRYSAWGEVRYQGAVTPTNYSFTGQASYVTDFGLLFYNSRFYDPALGRFSSPDTIIPGEYISQSWDRYAYVGNNPVKNTDPDGHCYPLCTMAIGAAIGAMVGGIAYTVANHGQSFDSTEFAVAVGAGIVTGGLIGTGVGIGMAAAAASSTAIVSAGAVAGAVAEASTAIGAGTAGAVTGGTYITDHPGEFDTASFAAQTITSTVAGGVSANPAMGPMARVVTNVIAAETGYYTSGSAVTPNLGSAVPVALSAGAMSLPSITLTKYFGRYVFNGPMKFSMGLGLVGGTLSGVISGNAPSVGTADDEDYCARRPDRNICP